ncbi:Uncharacterised protein [Segatella copri]|nr:Uncharacterised protein [Segatella copri]
MKNEIIAPGQGLRHFYIFTKSKIMCPVIRLVDRIILQIVKGISATFIYSIKKLQHRRI